MLDYLNRFKNPFLLSCLHLGFIIASYLFVVWPFFDSKTFSLHYDNMGYNFPAYVYFSNSLFHGFGFPQWYPYDGGLPVGITAITLLSLVPHRILSYLLYTILPLQPLILYEINVVWAMIIVGIGWWLFLYKLIQSRLSATVGCLALLLGGAGHVVLHMEQSIATMTYIPWILLVLLKMKERFDYILILAILCGFSMTVHYPLNEVLLLIFLFLALLCTGKLTCIFQKITVNKIWLLLLSVIFFVLAALPAIYVADIKDDFSSPVRQSEIIKTGSFEEYQRLNQGPSSATIADLEYYFVPSLKLDGPNNIALKVTFIQVVLVIIGIFYYRISLAIIIVLGFSIWAVLGINSSLPYLLFTIKFPFISYFRQWWHFSHFVNFCLSALTALGFVSLLYLSKNAVSYFCKTPNRGAIYNNLLIGVLTTVVLATLLYSSKKNSFEYMNWFSQRVDPKIERYDKEQFLEMIKSNFFEKATTLFVYKEWWNLLKECPELTMPQTTSKLPFITNTIYNNVNDHSNFNAYLKPFCNPNLYNYSIIASIPNEKVKEIKMDIRELSDIQSLNNPNSSSNHYFHTSEFRVSPSGVSLKVKNPEEAMAVLPYNYKLGLKVYLNSKGVETYPVYNGAMIGVFIPKGEFNLEAKMPFSFYEFAISVQALLAAFIFMYLISDLVIKPRKLSPLKKCGIRS